MACALVRSLFEDSIRNLPASASGHSVTDDGVIGSTQKVLLVTLAWSRDEKGSECHQLGS